MGERICEQEKQSKRVMLVVYELGRCASEKTLLWRRHGPMEKSAIKRQG